MHFDVPRVVLNGRFLAQPQTGVQRYAKETVLALDRLLAGSARLRRSFAIELAVPEGVDVPTLASIPVRVLRGGRGHGWEQIALALHARGAVLVNFSYSGPLFKRRQIVTIHDATVAVSPETFSRAYRLLHRLQIAVLGRRAEVVMTVSEFSRDEIAKHYGVRRPMVVGREGWEHARAEPHADSDAQAMLARHGLTSGGYLLAVGSVKPNKNFRAIEQALARVPELPWKVAIAGPTNVGIFRDADRVPEGVRMLGFVDDATLAQLYAHAAWFVFPSLYEGFGLPAIEAMANGCPVIAARAASIPEVCGDAAVYFDPRDPEALADTLRRVAADPAIRESVLARTGDRLARYSWRANAEILVQQLGALTRSQPRSAAIEATDP